MPHWEEYGFGEMKEQNKYYVLYEEITEKRTYSSVRGPFPTVKDAEDFIEEDVRKYGYHPDMTRQIMQVVKTHEPKAKTLVEVLVG